MPLRVFGTVRFSGPLTMMSAFAVDDIVGAASATPATA